MWTAYAPSRFQTPRSAKIVVRSPASVTRALKRILRAATVARSANSRRPSFGSSTFSLNFCAIAKVDEAVSFLRVMKLHAAGEMVNRSENDVEAQQQQQQIEVQRVIDVEESQAPVNDLFRRGQLSEIGPKRLELL